jgi:hypothetical protein
LSYRLFGWWYRWQACKLAAHVMSNRHHPDDRALAPICWSLAVFFELYLIDGADGTSEEFGPKEPVQLKQAANDSE